ncbi:MAG TPA: hypothetical protein VJ123_06985 [Anaerolineales bacterium]|nr:hypothetical protein [Anaerolineales bacterium]
MTPLSDSREEARRVVVYADEHGIAMRLLGGLAIHLHSPSATHRALARDYPDLDFLSAERRSDRVEPVLVELGYEPNKSFNLYNGDRRLLFSDSRHARQVDVFLGRFVMCHTIPLLERLTSEPITLPLAELLLTKLQIVEMNDKDVRDVCALVLDHPLGSFDEETVNVGRVQQLCADDWGLWKTVTLSLAKVGEGAARLDLEPWARNTIVERLQALGSALVETPKSLRWKMRAKIGEKVPWFELPEEVRRG